MIWQQCTDEGAALQNRSDLAFRHAHLGQGCDVHVDNGANAVTKNAFTLRYVVLMPLVLPGLLITGRMAHQTRTVAAACPHRSWHVWFELVHDQRICARFRWSPPPHGPSIRLVQKPCSRGLQLAARYCAKEFRHAAFDGCGRGIIPLPSSGDRSCRWPSHFRRAHHSVVGGAIMLSGVALPQSRPGQQQSNI